MNEKDNVIKFEIDGEEKEFNILFSYHLDDMDRDFFLLYLDENPEDIFVFECLKDGTMIEVKDRNLLKIAQDMLETYDSDLSDLDKAI